MTGPNTAPATPGYNPQLSPSIGELPANFLAPDALALQESAGRVRSMADLVAARNNINQSGRAGHTTATGLAANRETHDDNRHMQRGASLAWDLLRDAAPEATRPRSSMGAEQTDGQAGNQLLHARDALIVARRTNDPQQIDAAVDAILGQSGINEAFTTALGGLSGPGLEETTLSGPARYGAAHVVLSAGYANTYPAE
ncbi:MAG TPA: hypothetical protein VLF71_05655 [Candidatus Saccharimonadales bacterium]|nr:hypothetical protein [Candidatus Saccharimonadales bacterium]